MSEQRNSLHLHDAGKKEIGIVDMLRLVNRHKGLIATGALIGGALGFGVSMLSTPTYGSTAKILPPQQQQSSNVAAMLGQLGGLAGSAGIKTPSDLYIGMLESRSVADNLIARMQLKERYHAQTMDDARSRLARVTTVASGKKDGMITVTTVDREAGFAADLANAYIDELTKLTQKLAISEASQRRLFFEKQLLAVKDQLAGAEVALRSTQESTGMIEPESQMKAIMANAAQVKGAIAAKEVQLSTMQTYAAPQNPELRRAQEELRGLRAQLSKLESRGGKSGDFMVPTGQIPEVGVQYVRSMRDVKYYETMFEMLAKQFELAKIDEAKDSSIIQVLDRAVPAERKTKASGLIYTLLGLLLGAILGIGVAFARGGWQRMRSNLHKQ